MVFAIVLITILVFLTVDLALRLVLNKIERARVQRERRAALDTGLKLEFADEARSLKRVEVENPKAKILAVDDEPVVLESLRKILVLNGYSIDTVETGQEALSLVRQRSYDFVFTDLKMPGMNGVDVTKGVKHLRPDIDVVIITGYATIESAIETMRLGALDYVQKPFSEDELAGFVKKLVFRRQDRLAGKTPLEIHLVTATAGELPAAHVVNVPGGVYVSPQHTWASVQMTGSVRVGLDDFAYKVLGEPEQLDMPEPGSQIDRGDPLFTIRRGESSLRFPSPVSGTVSTVNHELIYRLDLLPMKPYEAGWICALTPSRLGEDLAAMRIGVETEEWYGEEIERYQQELLQAGSGAPSTAGDEGSEEADVDVDVERSWSVFGTAFLQTHPVKRRMEEVGG
jgi:DNA-binding response OmpR family regulator